MVRTNVDSMDVDDIARRLIRQRNRNRLLVVGAMVLFFVSFVIVTTVVYLNP